jgi:hypothetical protein
MLDKPRMHAGAPDLAVFTTKLKPCMDLQENGTGIRNIVAPYRLLAVTMYLTVFNRLKYSNRVDCWK